MHEIGIVRSLCRTVTDCAEKNQVTEIAEIVCSCGELSLVIPKYVDDIYPVVVEEYPMLKNTKLTLETVPGLAECDDCDEIFNVVENRGYCPKCGSFEKQILSGQEFTIKEIHVPEK